MKPSQQTIRSATKALEAELDAGQIIVDSDLLEKYASDWSGAGAHMPDIVVKARSTLDVQTVFRVASEGRIPVTPRGLGSGKSGGALPIFGGIVLSLEDLNRVEEISREDMLVRAGAGTVTKHLMDAVEAEGLFYPPDPNSLDICSIGGNVACNAGGPRAVKYGVTRNYVLELTVVIPTGQVLKVGKRTRKHVTGYDLSSLIVGSEGTLGVITEVNLRLIAKPAAVQTALVSFADLRTASQALTQIFLSGIVPRTLELLDHNALAAVRHKTPGRFPENAGALIILETDGTSEERAFEELEQAANVCMDGGALDVLVAQDEAQRKRIWEPRRVLSITLTESAPRKISEDIVVPRSQIPAMLDRVAEIGERRGVRVASYGHAGDGNLHINVLFDEATRPAAEAAVADVMQATVDLGGTLSGEHGVGLTKRDFLPIEQSPPLIGLQQRVKAAFDPLGILNPGKIFPLEALHES
jgi:glycolate oxidase